MSTVASDRPWPTWWRYLMVALVTLILCSCRGATQSAYPVGEAGGTALPCPPAPGMAGPYGPMPAPMGPPGMAMGVPLPYTPAGAWIPPGLERPWPQDEYLADGGDAQNPAGVVRNELAGLDVEDAVAQFDTLDGRTLVQPSNRVYVYSPRFLAVRQVVSICENEQMDQAAGVVNPEVVLGQGRYQVVGASKQNLQTVRQVGQRSVTVFREKEGVGGTSQAVGPRGFASGFSVFENFSVIKLGVYDEAEMPFLAKNTTAAISWTHNAAVQVILDGKAANALVQNERVETVFTYTEPPANPKLRIIKVASTQFAEPGDTVDFTLRFDNIGNQLIGNVAVLDNLSPRLEYVPGSVQSSVAANFSTYQNEAGSAVLRWDLVEPLQPGRGGVVRFTCRVR